MKPPRTNGKGIGGYWRYGVTKNGLWYNGTSGSSSDWQHKSVYNVTGLEDEMVALSKWLKRRRGEKCEVVKHTFSKNIGARDFGEASNMYYLAIGKKAIGFKTKLERDTFSTLRVGAINTHTCKIVYRKKDGKRVRIVIEPYSYKDGKVFGWNVKKADHIRSYDLDRIESAVETNKKFKPSFEINFNGE